MKISLRQKQIIVLFAIIVVTIFFGLLYHWSLQVKPNHVDLSDFIPEEQEYQLLTNDNLVRPASFELPTVQTKPGISLKYQLIQLIEKVDLKSKKFTPLFFADKRIAELMKWGKDFEYQIWENILNRYYNSVSFSLSHLPISQPLGPLTEIYSHVLTHRNLISQKINEVYDNKQKQLLVILTDNIFQSIEKRILKLLPLTSPDLITYSLNDILKNKDFGYFDVSVDSTNLLNFNLTNTNLVIDDQLFFISKFDQENNQLVFHNIPLTGNEKSISFHFKPINLTPSKTWEEKIPPIDKKPYQYILPVNNLPYATNYRYQFESKINQSAQLQLEQQYATMEAELNPKNKKVLYYYPTEKTDTLINYTQYSHYVPFAFKDQINVENLRPNIIQTWVKLISQKQLSLEEIKSLQFNIYPYVSPSITMTKIAPLANYVPKINLFQLPGQRYQLSLQNTTAQQEQFIFSSLGFGWKPSHSLSTAAVNLGFWPRPVLGYLLLFSLLSLFFYGNYLFLKFKKPQQTNWVEKLFSYKTYDLIILTIKWPFKLIWKVIKYVSINIRLFWLIISLLGILFDIFIFKKNSDFITLLLTITWILTMIGYRLEARTSFLFALFYLVLCPFLLILKLDFIAEKAAIWTYMMLVVGTIQSIIELKTNPTNLKDPFTVINKISLVLLLVLNYLKQKLLSLIFIVINFFVGIIKLFINTKPRTMLDILLNIVKVVLFFTIFFFGLFILSKAVYSIGTNICQQYQKKVAQEKRERLWKSIIPTVDKIEPSLVYRGTKVVIYGRNFGWKNEPEIKLYKDNKEIIPDEITDDKVVFSVPLDWSYGKQTFQIEKIVGWDGKDIKVQTDNFSVKIIPVTGTYTKDDEEYFRLLPSLSPETRKRNGYQ